MAPAAMAISSGQPSPSTSAYGVAVWAHPGGGTGHVGATEVTGAGALVVALTLVVLFAVVLVLGGTVLGSTTPTDAPPSLETKMNPPVIAKITASAAATTTAARARGRARRGGRARARRATIR